MPDTFLAAHNVVIEMVIKKTNLLKMMEIKV